MAGRHQAQFTRYASMNASYPNVGPTNGGNPHGNSGNNLGVPFPTPNGGGPAQSSSQNLSAASVSSTGMAGGSLYHTTTPTMTSPYSTSSSPGYHSPNFQRYGTHQHHRHRHSNNLQLRKYTLTPPTPQPLSKSMKSLGYPGMYYQRPDQDEDIMTESNVRNGFIDRPAVSNEHTCAHDMVYSKLQDDQRILGELGAFAVDVLKRKQNAARITGPSTFRPPMRSTLIEPKKEQWMQDLANSTIPLRKLARNVPHGFKNEKLLETLAAKQVPFLRATWYIKVVGLSEMQSQRNTNNHGDDPHHKAWTKIVTNHLQKQLKELSPPQSSTSSSAVTTGRGFKIHPSTPNSHENMSRAWSSPESRAQFEQRWAYTTQLTKWQYCEGLLDQRYFLKWSLDVLSKHHSFEVIWLMLTYVVQDYLDEYRTNRALMHMLIKPLVKTYHALTQVLGQVTNEGLLWVYGEIKKHIERLLQSLFLSTPDVFVIPKLYHQYRHVFDTIFGEETLKDPSVALPDICHVMQRYWTMVKARNEVFCGTLEENQLLSDSSKAMLQAVDTTSDTTSDDAPRQGQMTEDQVIRILDSIGRNIDSGTGLMINENGWVDLRGQTATTASHAIFGSTKGAIDSIQQHVSVMCRWATSDSRHGHWRPYLVASILLRWRDQNATLRNSTLQDALIKWLDAEMDAGHGQDSNDMVNVDMTMDQVDEPKPAVILLFDTLIRMQLFSFQKFLLRLIARGDLEPKKRDQPRTRCCLNYLAAFPLTAPSSLVNQRRIALYGTRNGQASKVEDDTLLQLKRLAKFAVAASPEDAENDNDIDSLFGKDAINLTQPITDDSIQSFELSLSNALESEILPILRNATRYTVLSFTSDWLIPEVKRFVVKSVPIGEDNWRVMTSPGSCLLNTRQYVTIIKILEYAQDYLNVIDLALWMLDKSNERVLYSFAIDTLRKHASVWKLLNYGQRIADAIWEKHQTLQSQGIRERCLMMYMIQLVQEGYWISDEKRAQLQQDLHFKPKARTQYMGRNSTSLSTELNQLVRNPTMSSVQNAVDAVGGGGHNAGAVNNFLQSVFATAFDTLHQYAKENQITSLSVDQREPIYEFRRRVCSMVDFMKSIAEQTTLTGQLDQVVIQWLQQHCSPSSATKLDDLYEQHTWLPLFFALLVTRRLISIDLILKHFCLPWLNTIGIEAQQRCESQWTETTTETQPLRQLCKNIIILVRMLVVQENPEMNPMMDENQDVLDSLWMLRAEEIFQLQVQRQPQLATNLDKLDNMFGLVHSTITIVSNLPFSSLLIQDLVKLRTDLLQLDWFRRACTRDVNSIYQHFTTGATPASSSTSSTSSNAVDGGDEIRKKMLSIVDELIGGNMNLVNEAPDNMVPTSNDMEPNFGERLQAVFANLSQWNEEQCRVQFNLLLDNIMLPPSSSTRQTSQNENGTSGSGGDDTTTTAAATTANVNATASDNVVPNNTTSMDLDSSPAPTASIDSNKELDLFVRFYFDAVLFSANDNEIATNAHQRRFEFLRNLIQGLRKPVLLALLDHGIRMLEGHGAEELGFPYTILLKSHNSHPDQDNAPCFYSGEQYAQQCQAFFQIMQHLLAKDVWSDTQKIALVKALFRQVEQFRNAMAVYIVMESTDHVSFAEASRAIQLTKSLDLAVTMLKTEGLPEDEAQNGPRVMIEDIRISLLLRLRLLVPFASLIWEHPNADQCNIVEWLRLLVSLLGNAIVHGNGSQERIFEFVLDLVSLLIDAEIHFDLKKVCLGHLSSMHGELSGLPAMFHSRVKRILPYLAHNIYLSNTRLASSLLGAPNTTDPQQQQQHVEGCMNTSRPWEWLEDYANEPPHVNDAPISLALFHGCKAKKSENTYVRWYHFGFDDGLTTIADEDDDSTAVHVGMVGSSHRMGRRKKQLPQSTDAAPMDTSTTTMYTEDNQQQQHPPAKRRISEMEDGELP